MKLKKASSVDYVHQFSDIAFMKFRPKKVNLKIDEEKSQQENPFMSRIKSIINWKSSDSTTSSRVSQKSALQRSSSQVSIKSISLQSAEIGSTIIFLQRITSEHFLIGNQNQIDLVFIGGVVGNFIDTESIWELNIGRSIINLAIDSKKCQIAIETKNLIEIYHYDQKRIREKPQLLTGIKTNNEGKYIRFLRDSILAVFHKNFIEVYVVEENKMRRKMCKEIKQAADKELFQVPNAVENNLNIFYIKKSATLKTFQLWYMQIQLRGSDIEMTDLMKVYDIKEGLEKRIKLENFSKQIFLMNLGFEILAVKKGYIIDSAYLNIQQESTFLHYIGNNRLLHLSPLKAEVYRFNINFSSNPPRIDITSLDSIEIKKPMDYEYIGALEMFDRNFAVFYQIVPHHNRRTKGEITYCFAITKHVTVEEKINEIFTFGLGVSLKDVSFDLIEERVDMARKIGLNRTEIYLELWNRTNKTEVEEYKFLLDTLSYPTIKNEIEKKMKKSSMLWREVYKIEQSCFDMIRQNLFSQRCNQEVVKEYLTSHFLLRKLQFYRDLSVAEKNTSKKKLEEEEGDALKINIQSYNKYSKADIKTLFLQLIHEYCLEDKDLLVHIRLFLKSFRFIFRIIYKQLLEDIISTTNSSLIKLLENFPQILPYKHILSDGDDPSLYEGVWEEISKPEWDRNLHIEAISTIDNREVIAEIPNSLWFRRNFLTLHDMTGKSRQQITKINRENNSDDIFYFFISKVFEHVKEEEALNKIITFVQRNYEKMPVHIHEKIFLYRRIYVYFRDNNFFRTNEKHKTFHDLLQMKDYELFKEFFEFEKVNKGSLLRQIKQIYEEVGGKYQVFLPSIEMIDEEGEDYEIKRNKMLPRGTAWFNQGILSYFSSDLSEISDLKYILNRINSAKLEFFEENDHLIYVLVKSLELKVKVGSDNDVPIDEIMVYLENIPLNFGSPVLQELDRIQKISEEVERFQEIKINMTISEIIKNCQNVINALINQEIKKRKVMELTSMEEMKAVSYDILAEIQVIKQKIYTLEYSDLTFFVYLTKIMQEVHMIPYAAQLLNDPFLKKHYSIKDLKVVEDLILYMYKMKLSQNPKYIDNECYLTSLLQILPEDNECRIYIFCELEYAKMLSAPKNPVEYPITDKLDGITIVQLEERIQELPGDFLLAIDVEKLHQLMNTMQEICYEDADSGLYTTVNQIYEIIILKLIEDNLIVESLPMVRKLLNLPNNQFQVIFPLFYIDLISKELTVECKRQLLKAVSYLFNEPLELLIIVEELIGKVFSNKQRDDYFKQLADKSVEYRKNYNSKNPILDPIYLELIRNEQMENNFKEMIDQCGHHLVKTKEEFNAFQFSLLFVMLTQQPFALGKYLFCRRYHVNYKVMRSFLSYVIKEEIFSSLHVLEFGRRVFNVVLQASQSFLPFDCIASQYNSIPMDENVEFDELIPVEPISLTDDEFVKKAKMLESKIQKCILAFDHKKSMVLEDLKKHGPTENTEQRKQRIEKKLTNPVDLSEKAPSEYPFVDSDDDYGDEEKFDDFTKSIRRKKTHKEFNPSLERTMLMNRTSKNYALFMSTKSNEPDPLWLSSKGGGLSKYRKPLSKGTFAMDGTHSVQMSVEDYLVRTEKPRRSIGNQANRISMEVNLSKSIGGNEMEFVKSAILRKRKSDNVDKPLMSPQVGAQEESIEIDDDEEVEKYRIPSRNSQQEEEVISSMNFGERDLREQQDKQYEQNEQQEYGQIQFQINVEEVDENAFMPVQKMKQAILESVSQQGDQFYVDLSQLSLQQDKNPADFTHYLIQLLTSIYNDQDIKSSTRLRLVKETESIYPEIGISKEYMEVYTRFQSYHSKYDITIPMNEMFPLEFLFTQHKDLKLLFEQVAEKVVHLVDESNIYKISKIIHLAFKASSFQQEFFFSYLCMACEKFDSVNVSQNELNMQLEKLTVLIEKLPLHMITDRGHKMVQNMFVEQRKQKIVAAMVNYLSKKKSPQEADKFLNSLKSK